MDNKIKTKEDQIIFNEGEWEFCMYEIISGRVGIYANYGKENEIQLNILEDGAIFGELGLTGIFPRTATAVAKGTVVLKKINQEAFNKVLEEDSETTMKILNTQVATLRKISKEYDSACSVIEAFYQNEKAEIRMSETLRSRVKNLVRRNAVLQNRSGQQKG